MQGSAWALPCFLCGRKCRSGSERRFPAGDGIGFPRLSCCRNKTSLFMRPKVQKRIRERIPGQRSAEIYFLYIWICEKADPEKKVCSGDRISLVRTSMLSCICCTDSRSAFLHHRVRSVFESGFLRLTVFGADSAQGKRKIDLKNPLFWTDSAAF